MATAGTLQTRIENITGRDDLSTRIQTRILGAILEIQRRHNHYFMEFIEDEPMVQNQQEYPLIAGLTADYKDLKNIYRVDTSGSITTWDDGDPLDMYTFEEARHKWNADDEGDPEAYTLFNEIVYVWPPRPQVTTKSLRIEGYEFLTALTFPNGTNILTTRWDDLIEAWATWRFYLELPGERADEEATRWGRIAVELNESLTKFSNSYRLKDKGVMKIRTSPRQVLGKPGRPFGGR